MDPALLICIVGGITFIVAFLGCLGAVRENLILLKIFFYLLSVIFVGELTLGVVIFVLFTVPEARVNLSMTPEKVLRSGIIRYMDDDDMKEWMDLIQAEFRCCGIGHMSEEGFRDWQINMYFNCSQTNPSRWRCAVPTSCCNFEPVSGVNVYRVTKIF
ncbi:hypothetical protein ACJMK2_005584 [Sinanodonta woodiana]|uniref:Tetraspanin n=1 Tax=Sinanodonta woodiana TaxID=1069815 RepID=A0ABD3VTN3_SINWO